MTSPILITGASGMLGRSLRRRLAHLPLLSRSRAELDIGDARATDAALAAAKPRLVINCAAMTAVDRCESEVETAFRTNAVAAANLAGACHRHGARLIHFSTDYVFAGDLGRPYHEFDAVGPRTAYGRSKLAGEEAVRSHCPDHLILRTAWLYGPGGPSFLHTLRKLAAQGGDALKVVDDQVGNPTSTDAIAGALAGLVDLPLCGTVHLSCEGEASWFAFAREVIALAGIARGVRPCTTAEFPRPAPRPANSRLDKLVLRLQGLPPMPHWRETLAIFLKDFPDG